MYTCLNVCLNAGALSERERPNQAVSALGRALFSFLSFFQQGLIFTEYPLEGRRAALGPTYMQVQGFKPGRAGALLEKHGVFYSAGNCSR